MNGGAAMESDSEPSSDMRPGIQRLLLAHLVDQAPSRLRKRLDSEPSVADSWNWTQTETGWSIQANDETVRLQPIEGTVQSLEDVAYTCLLSPKCFHLLACCSVLPLGDDNGGLSSSTSSSGLRTSEQDSESRSQLTTVVVTDGMRTAASLVRRSLPT